MASTLAKQPREEPGAQVRATAAQALYQVLVRGQSLTAVLEQPHALEARDRALLHELCFGVLRTLPRLDALLAELLRHPLKARDQDLACLLRVGCYQLDALTLPEHAVVASTVAATRALGKPWARGLVNASLRRLIRERATLAAQISDNPQVQTLFPDWLVARLKTAWPQHWRDLLAASNARAPMFLRVNQRRITPEDYQAQLHAAGIAFAPIEACRAGLVLKTPRPVSQLPGFAEGLVSVQDAGAQHAALLLDAQPGQRVLDACAAPGNKAAHLQEYAGNRLQLTVLDADPHRLQSLERNFQRLGVTAQVWQADARQPQGDWAHSSYDRILLDAPCSGTGVIRRHPDIKWLRRDADIAQLVQTQTRLLEALWPLLAPGGTLLYVTCSLLPEENHQQIRAFLAHHADAREQPIDDDLGGLPATPGRQLPPSPEGSDGFFFARLSKA